MATPRPLNHVSGRGFPGADRPLRLRGQHRAVALVGQGRVATGATRMTTRSSPTRRTRSRRTTRRCRWTGSSRHCRSTGSSSPTRSTGSTHATRGTTSNAFVAPREPPQAGASPRPLYVDAGVRPGQLRPLPDLPQWTGTTPASMRLRRGRPAPYDELFAVPTATVDSALRVTFLGVSTLHVTDGVTSLLTDGSFSRPGTAPSRRLAHRAQRRPHRRRAPQRADRPARRSPGRPHDGSCSSTGTTSSGLSTSRCWRFLTPATTWT